ncbi:patatin-like phospholipase family protein [Rhodohalobacter sp.]|uniref:patatin-like phospholipase family protein n=1 Tax=Rhodohalobacter sp. TaxID=1974210 RepID=UPI002ACD7D84|nr:patatin-like phospholipase family protein [Rhodohalobacter sp.]MDZ7757704.1 patatin-like phospholipase family protein [Rhodohalobacter sp.]
MGNENHTVIGSPPQGYSGPKRSLVLAGGGMRVAYQAGVIRAMIENGLCFHHADGTSGGTMNLAMLFSGLSSEEMCERWRSLDIKKFVSMLPFDEYLRLHKTKAMGDADGIINDVFPHLGIDTDRIRSVEGMQGTFNVCNYTKKTNEAIPHTDISTELLVAGVSLPIFMPAVKHNGSDYIDSVWIKDANLMEAVKRGAEEIWLIWCIGNHGIYKDGMFDQYVHMIEMSANGVLFEEFDRINELNDRIKKGDSPYGQTKEIKLHVIKPEYPLPLDPDFYFNRIDASTLVSMGYADAANYLSTYNEDGISFEPSATRMKDPAPGVAFREKMEGWFSLGTTDPDEGAKNGEQENVKLSLNAAIYIHDLRDFLKNSTRSGMMAGHINFAPFDEYLPAKTGVFNLFVEDDDHGPDTKWMIYEMGFEYEGKSYYLAGKKEVRNDPGFDLWEDTTTLKVQLHEGIDASGPVVGAGVLKLSKTELLKLLRSMHAIAAESSAERFNLIANFGAFFLGELWDSYKGFAIHDRDTPKWGRYLKIIVIILGLAGAGWLIYFLFFS